MKRVAIVSQACVASVILLLLTGSASGAQNLAPNGGFEKWADGKPADWAGERASKVTDKAHVRTGRSAVKLTDQLGTDKRVPITTGTLYRVRVWAKGLGRLVVRFSAHGRGKADWRSAHDAALTDRWEPYQFYYGVAEERFRFVRITFIVDGAKINTRGKPVVAYLDDVTFEAVGKVADPAVDIMPNGRMERDAKRRGRPDGWGVNMPGSLKPPKGVGPDGSKALVSYGGTDPNPPIPAPDPKSWWDASVRQRAPDNWATPAASPVFPVEPGRTYRLRMQTRGYKINRVLAKLKWITTDGKPLGMRVDVRTSNRHGTWEWEEDELLFTAPTSRVKGAQLQFRTVATGGWLWVDNVSVVPVNAGGLGYVYPTPVQTKAVKASAPQPKLADRTPSAKGPRSVTFSSRPKSRVTVRKGVPQIDLAGGVTLKFRSFKDKGLIGISEITLGNLPLRNPDAPPMAPLVETATGGKYAACQYVSFNVAADGTVTIRTTLEDVAGKKDELDWIFKSVERPIGGQTYVGFAYGYTVRTKTDPIHEIRDRSTWELGGRAEGVTVVTQMAYAMDNIFTISQDCAYAGSSHYRYGHGDGLDYQFTPAGGLAVFFDQKAARMVSGRRVSLSCIQFTDTNPFMGAEAPDGGKTATTPLKCVLFARKGDHDEWTRARDYVLGKFAAYWGAKLDTPMPYTGGFLGRREQNVELKEKTFAHIADEIIPKVAPLGFKVAWGGTLSGHKGLGMYKLEPADMYGGMKGLTYLRKKAAALGVTLQCWGPTARVSQVSPLFREHPEWLLRGPGGRPPTGYSYPVTRACRLRSGWMDYGLKRYRTIRDETGLSCLWLDSYASYTLAPSFDSRKEMLEQAEDLFTWHGKLNQLGYTIYTEASGTLGIPSPGFPEANSHSPLPVLPDPRTRYGLSAHCADAGRPGVQAIHRAFFTTDYYYRLLANKGPCMVCWRLIRDDKAAQAKIARHNKDYNAVVDRMVWRHTLPDDRGVVWTDPNKPGTRILFSYKKARYTCPGITGAICVTTGKAVTVTGGFMAEPSHTYRITTGRSSR